MIPMAKKLESKKVKKVHQIKSQSPLNDPSRYFYWGMLILVVLFTAFIRIRLLQTPLERDEGEFAYMGQLILQGIPPYLISYNMKFPGIYVAYALIMSVFGESPEGIHLGFLVINAATIILIFLLAKRLDASYTGIIASASFAILSVSPSVLGTSAHATHFVLLPALGGICIMLKATDSGKLKHLFWSGILLGISLMIKQPGGFFIIFAFLYLLLSRHRMHNIPIHLFLKQGFLFLLGSIIPFVVTVAILYITGVFEKFWFWTFLYAYDYGTSIPLSMGLNEFLNRVPYIIGNFYPIWTFAALGISALFWDKRARTRATFVLGFSVFSFLALCSGLYFRKHYFVLILPAVALLTSIGISSFKRLLSKLQPKLELIPTTLFLAALLIVVVQYRAFFFELTPFQVCRAMYGLNPFQESIAVAEYIKVHSKEQDKIAVLGSEPQIYFYSKRHSATGYIYVYELMGDHKYALKMQKEMAEEIERMNPRYLIFINIPTSWIIDPRSERYIFNWFEGYCKNKFRLVGIVDMLSEYQTVYRWNNEAAHYSPRSPYFLCVYKNDAYGE
jgi:4-amino-4-deoxy-L-arabinose transferase-like glycosyltransferase